MKRYFVLFVLLVVGGVPSSAEAEGNRSRWTRAQILKGDATLWRAASKEVSAEFAAVVSGLLDAAADQKRSDDDRITAILLAGQTHSNKAVEFCVTNIRLRLDKKFHSRDDDPEKELPCFYVLSRAGWAAVPSVIEALRRQELDDRDLPFVAKLLAKISSRDVALALLQDAKIRIGGRLLIANVVRVMAKLKKRD